MENKGKEMIKREQNIDLMRTLAALFVIMVHVCSPFVTIGSKTPAGSTFCIASTIQIFTRIAVPLFVLISGRYLLDDSRFANGVGSFYKKRYSRIAVPFIFAIVIYGIFRILFNKEAISTYFADVIKGQPYGHLWYLYMLLGLYAVTPLINKFKNKVSHKAFRNFGYLMLIIAMITQLAEEITQLKFPILYFIDYMGFFITGYALKDYKPKNAGAFLLSYIIFCLAGSGLAVMLQSRGIFLWQIIHMGNNPIASPAAVLLYVYFSNIKVENSKLAGMGRYAFGIYIIHNMFVTLIMNLTQNSLTGVLIIDIILYWLAAAVISYVIVKLLWASDITRKLVK